MIFIASGTRPPIFLLAVLDVMIPQAVPPPSIRESWDWLKTANRMESRLNRHKNTKHVAGDREGMVRRRRSSSVATVAADYGLSVRKVRKWKQR